MATLRAFQLTMFMRCPNACLGCDSFVACAQLTNLRASTGLPVQQRILRQFFRSRSWAELEMSVFWVQTDMNPADPPSRADDFWSSHEICGSANDTFRAWQSAQEPFFDYTRVPPLPWCASQEK